MSSGSRTTSKGGSGEPANRPNGASTRVRVSIRDNEIVLNDFHEADPDVLAMARNAAEPDAAVHNALQVGARAVRLTQASIDVGLVETAFDTMSRGFDEKLDSATTGIVDATEALIDGDDGALPMALTSFREELDAQLSKAFDQDSKSSIIGKFDVLVRQLRNDEREAVRKLLDPGSDGSLIRRLQRDLTQAVRDESEAVKKVVQSLAEKVAADEAAAEVFDKTAIKGMSFE